MSTRPTGVQIEQCPGGPLLIRGATRVVVDGEGREVERPVVAVCRCGGSALFPYCDSTHKLIAAGNSTEPSR